MQGLCRTWFLSCACMAESPLCVCVCVCVCVCLCVRARRAATKRDGPICPDSTTLPLSYTFPCPKMVFFDAKVTERAPRSSCRTMLNASILVSFSPEGISGNGESRTLRVVSPGWWVWDQRVWRCLEGFVYFPRSEGTGGEFRLLSFDYIRPFRFDWCLRFEGIWITEDTFVLA